MNKQRKLLRERLQKPEILVLPGVYDALTAKVAAEVGFDALVMGGYSIAASRLGQPDVGYLSMTEMVQAVKCIVDATGLPVFADGDTGYGNALSVRRTMQEYEKAGAAAVLVEDQVWPKRCGHMAGKQVIDAGEHAKKITAARDARTDEDFLLIARTDARAVHGLDDAIERGKLYLDSGAEALFIEAPQDIGELETIAQTFPDTVLIANMIEGGRTPNLTAKDLENIGFKIVFWPCSALYVITQAFKEAMTVLHETGTTKGYEEKMMHFTDFNSFIGLDGYMELEKRYK